MFSKIGTYKLENLTPAFFGSAYNSKSLNEDFRPTELIAAWKRNILRLALSTTDNYIANTLISIFNKLKQGNYFIKIENYKRFPVGTVIIYKKFALDLRFSTSNKKIIIPLTAYKIELSLYVNDRTFNKQEKEYIKKSFEYTLCFSGIGKISSKGFGKFTNEELQNRNLDSYKKDLSLDIISKEINVKNWNEKLNKLLNENNYIEVKKVKLANNNQQYYFPDWKFNFFVYYLLFTCASKLKINWKNNSRQHGHTFHTFILGLPRKGKGKIDHRSQITGYVVKINNRIDENIKLISQIKYAPIYVDYAENNTNNYFKLLLLFYKYSFDILTDLINNKQLTHYGIVNNQRLVTTPIQNLLPNQAAIYQTLLKQVFPSIERIYNYNIEKIVI